MSDDTAAGFDGDAPIDTGDPDELEQLRAENSGLKDQALRYAAEAENTRRRAEREMNDARAYAIQKFARDLLGVADNLSRALQHAPSRDTADASVSGFVTGVEMTERELSHAFERNGLKLIAPERGGKFDPHLHQAMTEQPATDVPAGSVLQVLQTGYELFGRVVRPALVVVAAKGASAQPEPQGAYSGVSGAGAGGAFDTKA